MKLTKERYKDARGIEAGILRGGELSVARNPAQLEAEVGSEIPCGLGGFTRSAEASSATRRRSSNADAPSGTAARNARVRPRPSASMDAYVLDAGSDIRVLVSRVNVTDGPVTLQSLSEAGRINAATEEFLAAAVASAKSVLITGGVGSAKTTLLRALLNVRLATASEVIVGDTTDLVTVKTERSLVMRKPPTRFRWRASARALRPPAL